MRREAASPIYRLAFLYKIVIADSLQGVRRCLRVEYCRPYLWQRPFAIYEKNDGWRCWRLGAIEAEGASNGGPDLLLKSPTDNLEFGCLAVATGD